MSEEGAPYNMVLQPKLKGRSLENWSATDKAVLVIGTLTTVAASVWAWQQSPTGAIFLFVLLALLLAGLLTRLANGWGRSYEVFGRQHLTRRLRKRDGVWYQPVDGEGRARRDSSFTTPLKLRTKIVTAVVDGKTCRIPLLHHLDKPYDQLFIRAKGGTFGSLSGRALYDVQQELMRVCNIVLSATELHAGIAFEYVPAPIDEYEFWVQMSKVGSPLWRAPEQFKLTAEQREFADLQLAYANQLIPTFRAKGATDNWALIVLTIRRNKDWRKAEKGQLDNSTLYNLPVFKLGRQLVEMLSTNPMLGLSEVHMLTPPEQFLLNRISWDTQDTEKFYEAYHDIADRYAAMKQKAAKDWQEAVEAASSEDTSALEEVLAALDEAWFNELKTTLNCWPDTIVSVEDDIVRMNNDYISVIRVDETPEAVDDSEYLGQLESTPYLQWLRRYIGGESISGNSEMYTLVGKQGAATTLEGLLSEVLLVPDPKMRQLQEKLGNQANLVANHAIAQLFGGYWAVVAPDIQSCRDWRSDLCARLLASGFTTKVVDEPALHVDAVLTATLGAMRM